MSSLRSIYRRVHVQTFLPVFGMDGFDSRRQVEACVAAGCTAIEYTLRKPDAREMIPWIRKTFPEMVLLVGSTLDCDAIVRNRRRRHPQLMTVEELADQGVHGFVSMLAWSDSSIARYANMHLVIPTAASAGEALRQTAAGAHFQKMLGPDLSLVRHVGAPPAFGFCPVMVTGGQTVDRLAETFKAGAILVGTGMEVISTGLEANAPQEQITERVSRYLCEAQSARNAVYPELSCCAGSCDGEWFDQLPHYHPFGDGREGS